MDLIGALGFVLAVAAVAVVIGVRFGTVIAPRIGRALDRREPKDEEPGDRPA